MTTGIKGEIFAVTRTVPGVVDFPTARDGARRGVLDMCDR